MSYDPDLSDAHEGTRFCFSCSAGTAWLIGQRPPVTCGHCGEPIACAACGEAGFELDGDGRCSECVTPKVWAFDAEFGVRLVPRKEAV